MDIIEQFTYGSFVAEARDSEQHDNCDYRSSRNEGFEFTQTEDFDEAINFAVNGWDLGLEQYKLDDGVLVGGITELSPSLAGCLPHVQNHIMGFPEEMYALYDNREYNLPTLDIVVNLTYNCGLDSEDTLRFGKSMVNYINTMASSYNIRLTGIFAERLYNDNMYHVITLKDFDSALVINNIGFAFHPSFFRRVWFSVFEGKRYWQPGYGRPITNIDKIVEDSLTGAKADKIIEFKNLQNIRNFDFTPEDMNHVIKRTF